jgi:hypothetical protein
VPGSIEAGTLTKDLPNIIATATKEVKTILTTSGLEFGTIIGNSAKTFAENLWDGVKEWWNKPPEGRATGTLGMTGSLFEPSDFFGKVHKGETVFTPQQLEAFAKNVASASAPAIPAEFTSMIRNMQTDMSKPKEDNNIDLFANVFKDIQTTLSPANAPSKNPADNTEMIIAAQQMQSAVMKFTDITSLQATTPKDSEKSEIDFDKMFTGFFRSFQDQTGNIGNAIKSSFENLATVIPQANTQLQASDLSRTIPNEVKQAKVEAERQAEDRKKSTSVVTESESSKPIEVKFDSTATLDDLKDLLEQLNSTMGINTSHLSELINSTDKQVRATKRLDPNVTMRS